MCWGSRKNDRNRKKKEDKKEEDQDTRRRPCGKRRKGGGGYFESGNLAKYLNKMKRIFPSISAHLQANQSLDNQEISGKLEG